LQLEPKPVWRTNYGKTQRGTDTGKTVWLLFWYRVNEHKNIIGDVPLKAWLSSH